MLPQFSPTKDQSREVPSSSSSSFPLSSLSAALRLSISGEEMLSDSASGQEPMPEQHEEEEKEGELEIPEDIPVDLRAKLALAMINLGKALPEVLSY